MLILLEKELVFWRVLNCVFFFFFKFQVADIKRMNGLVTDIQMFGHRSIQIPLPGRHPPSPVILNGSSCNRYLHYPYQFLCFLVENN